MPRGVSKTPEKTRAKKSASLKIAMRKRWADPEARAQQSATIKAAMNRPEVKANHQAAVSSPGVRAKNSAAQKIAQNKPERRAQNSADQKIAQNRPDVRANNSRSHIELWEDPEYRKKMVAVHVGKKQSRETIEKRLRAIAKTLKIKPNKPEKFLTKILQELFPNQWKYVGDFQFIIGGKCPDCVNVNDQKKIFEMNGDY